jgi:hypothetical protein
MTAQTFAFARNQLRVAVERRQTRAPRSLPTLERMAELYLKLREFMVVDGIANQSYDLKLAEESLRIGVLPRFAQPKYDNAPPRGFQYGWQFVHDVRWRPKSSKQRPTRPLLFCEFLAAYDYPAGSASVRLTVGAENWEVDDQMRNFRARGYLGRKERCWRRR